MVSVILELSGEAEDKINPIPRYMVKGACADLLCTPV